MPSSSMLTAVALLVLLAGDPPDYLSGVEAFARARGAPGAVPDWSADDLAGVRTRLPLLARATSEPTLRWAVVLHLTGAARASLRGDGELRRAHQDLADQLLPLAAPRDDELRNSPERLALWRAVPLAAGYDLLRRFRPAEAIAHFERARRAATPDGHTLLALGMAEELTASSPFAMAAQSLLDPQVASRRELARQNLGLTVSAQLETRRVLESAERHLRDALALDPGLLEARLRLGRVLDLQDRTAAEDEWKAVLAARPGPSLTCLARALLGSRALRRGSFQDSAAHHRHAVAACPQAQSLHLGLSLALRRLGDVEAAGRELEAALALDPAAVDAWLRYATEPQRGLVELLEELGR